MKLPLFQVDAFTSQLFSGNPAAVVVLQEALPEKIMLAVAAENNLSETAFVFPEGEGFALRWFTPEIEVDLCGHATLASAYVLFETSRIKGDVVHFQTQSGPLTVYKEGEILVLDFPARPPVPVSCPEGVRDALGMMPREAHAARDLMLVYDSEEEILALTPHAEGILALDTFALLATAPGREVDFVSRFFVPKAGILEDPVTGSAHCTLTPYWAKRLGKKRLNARQVSKRGGELVCEDRDERVRIGGRAVLYLHGEIEVES